MRQARIKLDGEGFYHVMSRIVRREFWIDDQEKKLLLESIRRAAAFCGVEIYTYALMDNHFHLLVRVPMKREVDDSEMRRRMIALYGQERTDAQFALWSAWTRSGRGAQADAEKSRMKARMHDLSQFCKTFKERYTQAYNRRHDNAGAGTIWGSRFQSVLLEASDGALMTVAAYIHTNPVRAGIAASAEQSPWTGFGAACRGDATARTGLLALATRLFGKAAWKNARKACLNAIEGKIGGRVPAAPASLHAKSASAAPSPSPNDLSAVKALLLKRCPSFSRGGALGAAEFLERLAPFLPPRTHHWRKLKPQGFLTLGLSSSLGVRETA